jgi:hypothetical protein
MATCRPTEGWMSTQIQRALHPSPCCIAAPPRSGRRCSAAPPCDGGAEAVKTALVAIVIGDAYRRIYDQYIRARFESYAQRHGYDLRVIDQPIRDLPGKKFTWQKLLLPDPVVRRLRPDRVCGQRHLHHA